MKHFFLGIVFLLGLTINAQNTAISSNEKLTYTALWNVSGILNELAEVTMQTSSITTSSATLLRLKCSATTYSNWDHYFKIRDLYESYVNPKNLTPHLYKRDISEGGYVKFMQYKYNYNNYSVASLMKKKRGDGTTWNENKTTSIEKYTADLVATLYKIRLLNYNKVPAGKSKTFTVLFDNETHKVKITYLGKESITTGLGKKECYKLSVSVNTSDVLKGNNDNIIWLTADENKIPVFAKFKIAVGNGELRIKSATGLLN